MIKSYILSKIWYYFPIALSFIIVSAIFLSLGRIGFMPSDWALGLASECWGISATVLFLMLLLDLREYRQWSHVRDEVYSGIQDEMAFLFNNILDYIKDGLEFKGKDLQRLDIETRRKNSLAMLQSLKDIHEIKLNDTMLHKGFLEDRNSVESFLKIARRLSDIEAKYSKFFSPKVTLSLMKIQKAIHRLENTSRMYLAGRKLPTKMQSIAKEIDYSYLVRSSFKDLVEEIYNLHEMGIEFSYP